MVYFKEKNTVLNAHNIKLYSMYKIKVEKILNVHNNNKIN